MPNGSYHRDGPKIQDEKNTVENMIRFYCEKKHDSVSNICDECAELLDYSHARLSRCRYGEEKPTCRKCPVHCYKPDMRQQIRAVMRFSGPRLALRAPMVWIRHQLHDRKDID
ncbi:MAG: nitrous oxide-stimulated promoter family protein [Candidatus Thorarchaeota archaeon]|nr:MAG: nitrous oxide-stimulated promoter family protein [Candidatus Thorarchaeota archaeon]